MHKFVRRWAYALTAAVCGLSLTPIISANAAQPNAAESYYSSQLSEGAKAIYDCLVADFNQGLMKDGTHDVDITSAYVAASPGKLESYCTVGDRQLVKDYSAAKDAFDLEHPEAWYVDSSFLTLRAGKTNQDGNETQKYKAVVGTGREDNYYLNGQKTYKTSVGDHAGNWSSIDSMDTELKNKITEIANGARQIEGLSNLDPESQRATQVAYVHDQIIKNISYRFENEVLDSRPEHSLFVRTSYGLITHEGMCEAYARAFQEALNELDIPCVLIAGMQTSGDNPEQHMWAYVDLKGDGAYTVPESEDAANHAWYGVDVTWDDPVKYDEDGKLVTTKPSAEGVETEVTDGVDGRETSTYLLVGANTLSNWAPAGQFSQDGKVFNLPTLSNTDYSGGEAFNKGGLSVKYSSTAAMEDNTAAGTFTVSYNGMSAREAAEKAGVYILIKMIDLQDDGTVYTTVSSEGDEWLYAESSLALLSIASDGKPNPFYCDIRSTDTTDEYGKSREPGEGYLKVTTSGCDYVEFAITTQKPKKYETWWAPNWKDNILVQDTSGLSGYYHGDDSGVLNQTGELYNVNGTYSSQPFVYTQTPPANTQVATDTHMAKVIYDDALNFKGAVELVHDALQWDDATASRSDISKLKPPATMFNDLSAEEQAFQSSQNDRFVTYVDDYGVTKPYIRVPESEAHFTEGQNLGVWGTQSGKGQSGNHGEGGNSLQVAYKCYQKDIEGNYLEHTLQGKVAFDDDETEFQKTAAAEEDHSSRNWNELTHADGFVDANTPHFNWIFECNIADPNHKHTPYGQAVTSGNRLQPGQGCRLVGVEFEFDASEMWADDLTHYQFQIVGASTDPSSPNCLVGSRSGKPANTWQYLISSPMCPFAYESMGIDFSLWARPALLDNPNDIDLSDFTATDRSGNQESLQELANDMNLDYINGKLMLVVEDLSDKRGQVGELEGQLAQEDGIPNEAIKSRSVYDLNFANICKSTIAKVQHAEDEGDVSMRVQVGFPPGYGPEDAGVVFKAYHFDRDESGNVTGVQEIPVVVTEYGLVIMCNRFSPFEIVALDSSNQKVQDALQDGSPIHNNDLIVSSDGHVKVTVDGKDVTAGDSAIVHMHGDDRTELTNESTTFTLTPDPGYEVQGATLAGGVKVLGDAGSGAKTVTVTKDDMESISRGDAKMGTNTILAVTGIPSTVKAANEEMGMETAMVSTCDHKGTIVTDGEASKDPTCTESGRIQGKHCTHCNAVLQEEIEYIAPTGHTAVGPQKVDTPATCTDTGKMNKVMCSVCGEGVAIAEQTIPARGHAYDQGGVCTNLNGVEVCGSYSMARDNTLAANIKALEDAKMDEGSFNQADYTDASWQTYANALATAKSLVEKYNAAITYSEESDGQGGTVKVPEYNKNGTITADTKTEVANATAALIAAEEGLEKKPTDFSALRELVADVSGYLASNYAPESWETFSSALREAQAAIEAGDADQASVDDILSRLQAAELALTPADKPVDRSALVAAVEAASKIKGNIYTPESWSKFEEALATARSTSVAEGVSQDAVNAALRALKEAEAALVLIDVKNPSTAALETLISDIEALSPEIYTDDTWTALQGVLAEVKQALASGESISEETLDTYFKKLQDARSSLVEDAMPGQVDKDMLSSLVESASKLHSSMYTASSWKAFAQALDEAKTALQSGQLSNDQLVAIYTALANAEASLSPITLDHPALAPINQLLEDIADLDSSIFTEDSWAALQAVVDEVQGKDLTSLTSDEIDALYKKLYDAYSGLGENIPDIDEPTQSGVDKSKLEALVKECDSMSKNGYTFDSLYRFILALRNAHTGLTDQAITQNRVNRLYNALLEAKDGLVKSYWNQPTQTTDTVDIYRLYNPYTGEHLFTTDEFERDSIQTYGWKYEGVAWTSPKKSTSVVYRLFNPYTSEHHYTADLNERNSLVLAGWNAEGIGFYSDVNTAVPIYRLYNPYVDGPGAHHYTLDVNEYNSLPTFGWNQENVAFYGVAK